MALATDPDHAALTPGRHGLLPEHGEREFLVADWNELRRRLRTLGLVACGYALIGLFGFLGRDFGAVLAALPARLALGAAGVWLARLTAAAQLDPGAVGTLRLSVTAVQVLGAVTLLLDLRALALPPGLAAGLALLPPLLLYGYCPLLLHGTRWIGPLFALGFAALMAGADGGAAERAGAAALPLVMALAAWPLAPGQARARRAAWARDAALRAETAARQHAERALARSEQQLHRVLAVMPPHPAPRTSGRRAGTVPGVTHGNVALGDVELDTLTGLPTRRGFAVRCGPRLRRADRLMALLLLDIDRFGALNEIHGHGVGDELLAQLGALLAHHLRQDDVGARDGGERFIALLDVASAEVAIDAAERLRQYVCEHPFATSAGVLRLRVSIGLTLCAPGAAVELTQLLPRAERALALAKQRGRNRVEMHRSGA